MDIFEMLEILVDLKLEELKKEDEKEVITINRKDFSQIMASLTAFYMRKDPEVGITLLRVVPVIGSLLFDKELKDKILSVSKEEK